MIRRLSELDVRGKRVLVRVDFNVPLAEDGTVRDDTRIRGALPTIRAILEREGIPILMSHLGRPKGTPMAQFSLRPVAQHLAALIGTTVHFAPDCIGHVATATVSQARPNEVVLLENLRFHPGEEENDRDFAASLAQLGDAYVNDAFGAAHRAHASISALAENFVGRRAMGLLMEREIQYLSQVFAAPRRPFVAIIGGAKISDKIRVLENLLQHADFVLIGGGMANTFLAAQGRNIGESIVDERFIELAHSLYAQYATKLYLPIDAVLSDELNDSAITTTLNTQDIPPDTELKILDIGPETVQSYRDIIQTAELVVWNGPMGVFEFKPFRAGTLGIATSVAEATARGATTIVGGGDSIAALTLAGVADQITHVSTGGGATLEYLEGKVLPGIAALEE
ncbi:MAG: phosphoglycerate kinase [Bacteroidota bacterium]|nr:phosphoglycerate kinase [Candidatus Kapabacteria bacterium]MCS7302420.1 phosphoglycerate kinase [Candidatus Kapabacteria bacterium]MCX7937106.1 phosphoglycerate kinase [Chlorobiota bacterium]MDW8074599.1 phosphoglycerate kinase [Bacteroidota bacterium]MDW8270925.1 phosphoglycerate kinase [Bacteroidota bacterium]